ncbi:hypothetical protein BOTCAL_0130g00170 [Botryotinia calthae]|uniref:Uncharacterized protein n=1 Tax=Botryotinia calthae TaxID=38488 RepID=A0A4Y8D6H3_9HELO|nr:hypothetical protein BOTCAL_0130g00170 [Botryotinia calthae]
MAKGPITIHTAGQGTCNLVHYPLQDTLPAIDDIQRQRYNRELICKGVSDDGDEELLRNDNYKRLFPWYKTPKTLTSIKTCLWRARKELNKLLRSNNKIMGVVQPPASSKLPPNLTPAQKQQVQVQEQVYDAQVAASQVAASSNVPLSIQAAGAPESSQSESNHNLSAQNHSAIRLQSIGHFSPWVEPSLAYDNLLISEETTNRSGQPGFATDSRSRQAPYQARFNSNARTRVSSERLSLQNERRHGYATDTDSDSHTESETDITDTNQLLLRPSTFTLPRRPKTPFQSSRNPLNTQEDCEMKD